MEKYVIAIDAGGTFFKSAIVSKSAEVLSGSMLSVPANNDSSSETVKEAYHRTLKTQIEHARRMGIEISAVAIDTPGPFDYKEGISLMKHKFKAIYKIPLRPWISEIVGDMPITFIHDSAAFLMGESWNSPYGNFKNAAGVMIGTGLGFATMKEGEVLRLDNGEPLYSVWNTPVETGDGKKHIAEEFVSGKGLSAAYKSCHRNAKELEILAISGDEEALSAYKNMGRVLGTVIAPYLKKTESEILILGGQISRALPLFEAELKEALGEIPSLKTIVRSGRLEYSHLLGAAYDCFKNMGVL